MNSAAVEDDDSPDDSGGAVEHLVREIEYGRLLLLLQNDGRNSQQSQDERHSSRFGVVESRCNGRPTPGAIRKQLLLLSVAAAAAASGSEGRFVSFPDLHPSVRASTTHAAVWIVAAIHSQVLADSRRIQSYL